MRLDGMTAVVTGGASGLGESMVYAPANEGASIVVVDRNMGRPSRRAHVTAKSGLLGLTRTMAIDLATKNIVLTEFLLE